MSDVTLESRLPGVVGDKTAAAIEKAFGYRTVGELLSHYPRRWATRGELTPIVSIVPGEDATIVAEVVRTAERRMRGRAGAILDVVITDGLGQLSLTFFNQSWRQRELIPGARGMFSGRASEWRGGLQLTHPSYQLFEEHSDAASVSHSASAFASEVIPIYPATSAVPSWSLQRAIGLALDVLGPLDEPLPEPVRDGEAIVSFREALELVHRPERQGAERAGIQALRVQEAFVLQSALLQQRAFVRAMSTTPRPAGQLTTSFDAALPFALTPDQRTVGETIARELAEPYPMNRLVQGEVGSGKTLVALRAMLQVADAGGQSALIAPTEVLAGQHLRSITSMLGPALAAELMPTLLTGQMPASDRRRAALRVASGQARLVIGTHALLSEKTTFADLGLVVIDEQHRFGVEQRERLRAKGSSPHALVLTATPIPRTVAMTVFGDLDVSTIRTMPAGRAGIESFVAPLSEHPGWFARVWDRAAEEISAGHQVFVVCPAIDTDDPDAPEEGTSEAASGAAKRPRWGVVQVAAMIAEHPRLREARIATLHGGMPGDEKERIMRELAAGQLDLLVATTVIEVGVDVPGASTMIVLDADRFGVSQLHQLRGRVGRGAIPGLCLLVTDAQPGTPARARVDAVAATLDGFALAEVDLELRGEGDVLGAAQSGGRSSLRLLRAVSDAELIARARDAAARTLAEDPALTRHPALAQAIARRMDAESWAAIARS